MKKIIIVSLSAFCLFLAACGSNSSDNTAATNSTETTSTPSADLSKNPDYQKGLTLVASNNCLTCHKVDGESTGPAYVKVANKYEATDLNIDMLAKKIISGGSGHWGAVPMIAHPNVTLDQAKQMVKYILLLRTNK